GAAAGLGPRGVRAGESLVPAMKLSSSSVRKSATTSTTTTSYSISRMILSTKSTATPMCSMPTGCCGVTIGIDTTYWLPTRNAGGQKSVVDIAASTEGLRKCSAAPSGGEN